jgi:hypothetical protein
VPSDGRLESQPKRLIGHSSLLRVSPTIPLPFRHPLIDSLLDVLRVRREPNRHPRWQTVQAHNHRAKFHDIIGRFRAVFPQAQVLPILPDQHSPTTWPGIWVCASIYRHRYHLARVNLVRKLLRVLYWGLPSVAQLLNPISLLLGSGPSQC